MARVSFWGGRRFATGIALLTIGFCTLISFGLPEVLSQPGHPWILGGDTWTTTNSAQYLSYGGIGSIYSINPFYSALPGFLALYAPVVALGDHLGLMVGYPWPLPRPSMWILAGPFFFVCGSTALPCIDYLAHTLGVSRIRRRVLGVLTALFVVVPTACLAGHPEDMLALGLSCVALALLLQGRLIGATIWLSAAVMMQTWAGLLIPLFLAVSPAGTRLRTLARVAALPAAVGLLLLALDWPDASVVLLHQPMTGEGQHLPWWQLAGHVTTTQLGHPEVGVTGSTTRSVALFVAVAMAWMLRRRVTPDRVIGAAAVALYARGLFETEFWPYYLAPAAVMFAVLGASATAGSTKRFAVVLTGAGLLYASAPMSYVHVQYPAALALLVLLTTGALCVAGSFPALLRLAPRRFRTVPLQAG